MASNVFGAKQFKPTAPDKGSFPLDHEGECRVPYLQYMVGGGDNVSTRGINDYKVLPVFLTIM